MHTILCISYSLGMHMARTTISVSDDLKRRMDRVKEPINWSAVAAEAFEQKLGEIARKREVKTMDNVIERLRASKNLRSSDLFRQGRELGAEWAKNTAEYDQLERLSQADPDKLFSGLDEPGAYASSVAWVIIGATADERPSHQDLVDVWDNIIADVRDSRLNSEDFLRGFMEGAEDIYREVVDEI